MDWNELRGRASRHLDRITNWPKNVTPEQRMAAAEQATQMFGGFGPGTLSGGMLGTLVNSRHATPSELLALEKAAQMHSAGVPAREVHAQTGWFRWPGTGEWVTEFSDAAAKYRPMRNPLRGMFGAKKETMADVLDHPELYQRFPRLAEAEVQRKGILASAVDQAINDSFPFGGWTHGWYDPRTSEVGLNSANFSGPARKTLLHEIAGHGVQKQVGFEPGINPGTVRDTSHALMKLFADRAAQLEGPYQYWTRIEAGMTPVNAMRGLTLEQVKLAQQLGKKQVFDQVNQSRGAISAFRNLSKKPFEGYTHTDGEAMARLVEKRSNLTRQELQSRYPLDDLDVAPEKLIPALNDMTPYNTTRLQNLIEAWKD